MTRFPTYEKPRVKLQPKVWNIPTWH